MLTTDKSYAVFNTRFDTYVSRTGYHYSLAALEAVEYSTIEAAQDCANFLINENIFDEDDLVIHEIVKTVAVNEVVPI